MNRKGTTHNITGFINVAKEAIDVHNMEVSSLNTINSFLVIVFTDMDPWGHLCELCHARGRTTDLDLVHGID